MEKKNTFNIVTYNMLGKVQLWGCKLEFFYKCTKTFSSILILVSDIHSKQKLVFILIIKNTIYGNIPKHTKDLN